jgi:hypothetical protein
MLEEARLECDRLLDEAAAERERLLAEARRLSGAR